MQQKTSVLCLKRDQIYFFKSMVKLTLRQKISSPDGQWQEFTTLGLDCSFARNLLQGEHSGGPSQEQRRASLPSSPLAPECGRHFLLSYTSNKLLLPLHCSAAMADMLRGPSHCLLPIHSANLFQGVISGQTAPVSCLCPSPRTRQNLGILSSHMPVSKQSPTHIPTLSTFFKLFKFLISKYSESEIYQNVGVLLLKQNMAVWHLGEVKSPK